MTNPTFGEITKYLDAGGAHPFVVYLALNKLTGDFYVGATEKGTRGREAIHKSHARHGGKKQHFYRAIRKHGEENFKFLTIKECSDYWDALESERAYIALLKPRYNMTTGGGGVKGFKFSPESKAKMSLAKKGKPGIWSRQAMPPEMREKLADARRADRGKPKTSLYRAVVHLPTGVEYPSVKATAAAHSCQSSDIVRRCKIGKLFAYKDRL